MGATLTTIDALLMKWYFKGVIQTINNEAEIYGFAKAGRFDWSGQSWNFSLHVARNSGSGWKDEDEALPTAGNQGWIQLTGSAQYIYSRFKISGQAIKAAKGNPGSVLPSLDSEIKGSTEDVTNDLNKACVYGGLIKGFIFERKNAVATPTTWAFSGNNEDLAAAVTAGAATVDIIRLDTYAVLAAGITITAANENSIVLSNGGVPLNTTAAALGATWTPGMCCAVRLAAPAAQVLVVNKSLHGIYANLVDTGEVVGAGGVPELYTKSRVTYERIRSNIRSVVSSTVDGDYGYSDLTLRRMQDMFALIKKQSGKRPSVLQVNPATISSYTAILQGTAGANIIQSIDKAGKGDAGFAEDGLGYAGVPFKSSQHFGVGVLGMLSKDSWKLASLMDPQLAQEDGKVLNKVADKDAYEGFVAGYLEMVCVEPRSNALLVGVNYSAI